VLSISEEPASRAELEESLGKLPVLYNYQRVPVTEQHNVSGSEFARESNFSVGDSKLFILDPDPT
jgi:hypothetical protein